MREKTMTKSDLLNLIRSARRAIEANRWEVAIAALERARPGLVERRDKKANGHKPFNVRIRLNAEDSEKFDVYMGGVVKAYSLGKMEARTFAKELTDRYGGSLVEVAW